MPASTSSIQPMRTQLERARRRLASPSRIWGSPGRTSSLPRKCTTVLAQGRTMWAPRAGTSWTRWRPAFVGCRRITSIQGKGRYIGVSNWPAGKIAKAIGISRFTGLARFETLQAYYSIAGRDLERELVPFLESEKAGLLVWSPLAGGLLSGKFSRQNQRAEGSRRSEFDFPIVDKERTWKILEVMAPIAKAHDCSPARISLAWLLTKPVVTSVIIGAKRLDQLQDNLAAVEIKFTEEEIQFLDEVSALPPEYPGWMKPFQDAGRLGPVDPVL